LKNNIKGLTELAELLLEKEVIFGEDLERIFGKRKADLIKEADLITAQLPAESVINEKDVKNDPQSSEKKVKNKRKSGLSEKGKDDLKKPSRKPKVKE